MIGVVPARGKALVRRITTEQKYAGSRIYLTDQSRDAIANCQFEIIALGKYERCEEPDECKRRHNKWNQHEHRLECGAWVLVRNRSWSGTDDPHTFVVKQSDILGVFEEGK